MIMVNDNASCDDDDHFATEVIHRVYDLPFNKSKNSDSFCHSGSVK